MIRDTRQRLGSRQDSQSGSVLILALVYIISISLVVGALADWAMNDLNNTTHFKSASSLDYAATGAMNVAISSIRYTPLLPNTPTRNVPTATSYCWTPNTSAPASDPTGVSQVTINSVTVAVWCSTVPTPAHNPSRVVTFYACQSSLTSTSSTATVNAAMTACASTPLLTAVVQFNDYPQSGGPSTNNSCSASPATLPFCGEGAQTNEWVWA